MSKVKRPGRGWAYACAQLGGVASIAANVAHSFVPPAGAPEGWTPAPGAVISSVFWPVALFFAIEAFSRVPWPDQRRWVWLRFGGLLPVAAVAAVVSYMHLSGLLDSYGAGGFEVHVGPLAVDGLMVIGTAALIATSRARQNLVGDQVEAPTAAVADTPPTTTELWERYAEPVAAELTRPVEVADQPDIDRPKPEQVADLIGPGLAHLDVGLRAADRPVYTGVLDEDGNQERTDTLDPVDQVAARRRSDDELWQQFGDQLCREWITGDGITRYRVEVVTGAARRQAERLLSKVENTVEQPAGVMS
jgi:hypothetical protein